MTLLLKNLLFTFVVPCTVAVFVPLSIAGTGAPAAWWTVLLALPLFLVGAATYAWCVWDFATFGRATPAPIDAPKQLVVRGLYRYMRNPMYLGVLTVILGWTVLFRSLDILIYGAVVAVVFHLFVVLYEEPALTKRFGDDYATYRGRAPRWLPRFRHG